MGNSFLMVISRVVSTTEGVIFLSIMPGGNVMFSGVIEQVFCPDTALSRSRCDQKDPQTLGPVGCEAKAAPESQRPAHLGSLIENRALLRSSITCSIASHHSFVHTPAICLASSKAFY